MFLLKIKKTVEEGLNFLNLIDGGALAGGQGFEPRLMEPESIVLPLDDPPVFR